VDRVVIAVDCGLAINPDVIRAQMEGGMGYGLSAALSGAITLKGGRVEQSNFHDYTVLRIDQMPDVEVYIVDSTEAPTGVGEPGVPPHRTGGGQCVVCGDRSAYPYPALPETLGTCL
jgi:isoquinoline 1-oxidoreductase beta subunit